MTYDVKSQKMIKSSDEIAKMKVAGKLAAQTLEMIEQHVQPGVSTGELDRICHDYIAVSYTHLTLPTKA